VFFNHFLINILSSFQKTFSFIHQFFLDLITLIRYKFYRLFFTFVNVFVFLILVNKVAEYTHLQWHFFKLFLQIIIKTNLKLLLMLALYIVIVIILHFLFLFLELLFFPKVILTTFKLFNSLVQFCVHLHFML